MQIIAELAKVAFFLCISFNLLNHPGNNIYNLLI
jgi:hypothetical protein